MTKFISTRKTTAKGVRLLVFGIPIPFCLVPTKASKTYARRFDGLSNQEIQFLLESLYEEHLGEMPNLASPKYFNEKLTWLKLHYHNPLLTVCADKVEGRNYFLSKMPNREDLLVKQLGAFDSADEIDFAKLPTSFVLKSNWGSGCQFIIRNKNAVNQQRIKKACARWQRKESNHYYDFFEWGYKNIVPKIVCEELLDFEYKIEFFCFNGEPKFFWIVLDDKTKDTRANFYTLDWEDMGIANRYPNFKDSVSKPAQYDEMLEISRKLSHGFPFMRCDFYKTKTGFRFSEMTFYHWGCTMHFEPRKYNRIFGDMLTLPTTME